MTNSPPPRSRRPSNPSHTRTTSFTPSLRRRTTTQSTHSDTSLDAETAEATHTEHAIVEEIASIKRYEDFSTIDWVQDAAREQLRRKARRNKRFEYGSRTRSKRGKLRRTIVEAYDAGQAWIVVTLVGAAIGLNAAVLNIVTEWLSDIKLGHCTTAFYLNENFCCWGAEGGCEEWKHWSGFWPVNYVLYICFAALFSFTAARLVKSFAPYAAGSGISEMKCIIAGFVMKGFLGATTLFIKSIGLPLAIASGLSVGKEGPSVHYAVCTGNVISRFFDKYRRNAAKTREILSASAAAGVGVAFGSPIGGVLFSLEEMSNCFPLKTLWRSYFCALVATAVLAAMNPFRTGQLVMFQVKYDRGWHFFEILFYLVIGIFGGLYGAFVIKWNLKMQVFRKKYLSAWPITEAVTLAVITAIICYPNMFLRIDMTESMEILFQECEGGHDYNRLCDRDMRWHMIGSLAIATIIRTLLVVISFGCKVPAGIFVPSMAVGAAFGRMVGIFVQHIHESFPASPFFSACEPDGPCITPGTYAFLGAAAALSGIMHISISVVVIMFEITGALTYILPTMIVVGVTKFVSERFGHGGIADRMIYLNGYPFLDSKEEHTFGVPVSQVMAAHPTCLPANGMDVRQMERIINENQFQGYPVVEDMKSKILVGYVGRTELKYALEKARNEGVGRGASICFTNAATQSMGEVSSFAGVPGASTSAVEPSSSSSSSAAAAAPAELSAPGPSHPISSPPPSSKSNTPSVTSTTLDFSRYIDPTPLTIHPRLPLETTMELFKKMGPRVILIEYRGRLTGLVTVKDCLKYQFKVEARGEHGHGGGAAGVDEAGMERLFGVVKSVAVRIDRVVWKALGGLGVKRGGGGEVRLGSPSGGDREWVRREREVFRVGGEEEEDEEEDDGGGEGRSGTGNGVELEDRRRGGR